MMRCFELGVTPAFLPSLTFTTYRKKVLTRATRVDGPFQVETTEGILTCQDGWLAFDARGNPYPIANDEFNLIYEAVKE
jgi:hypothetical protein